MAASEPSGIRHSGPSRVSASLQKGDILKKLLALVVLTGIALTGCGKASSAQPVASTTVAAEQNIAVPNVVGLTLDKATDQLKDLGLKVEAEDVNDGKTILSKKNWEVVSQDPKPAAQVEKDSKIKLGVRHLTDETATPTPTPTPTQAVVPLVAPPAPPVVETPAVVVPPPVVEAPPVAPAVPAKPPVQQAPPAAPAPYYKNCAAVRAAGAAPIHISQPGYGSHLDKDGDGWGCDK
ncbi:excalibur calcium-binding domain-containing protein [Paenarthrobacter sp. CM16]|uniref:excalibur calcium-binding domain-containing protein n=1 Tax=Paenarthrobacter sp. CM16 TaxID=2738447 RepID=UPI0020A67633|nr:excalibur calcium-binding domain-containing protein [Paenarthrobacter sp. CM16]